MRSSVPTNRPLFAGELARLAGISPDAVRFYERRRLLPTAPRSASGYRIFPREAVARVQLIRGALSIGFRSASWPRFSANVTVAAHRAEKSENSPPKSSPRSKPGSATCARGGASCAARSRSGTASSSRLARQAGPIVGDVRCSYPKSRTRSSALSFLARGGQKQEKQL